MVRLAGTAFKGVFLDMDGVVADSSSFWDAIIRIIRQEFVLDMSVLEKSGGYDYTTAEALCIVLESMGCFSGSLLADIMRRIDTIYLSGLVSVKPVPGIPDVLDMLDRRGVMTALVSNSSRYQVSMMLEHLGLEKHFQTIVTADDVARGKPSAEPYLKALELSGLSAQEAVAVEDSSAGVRSALDAGLGCVLMVSGNTDSSARMSDSRVRMIAAEELYFILCSLL